MENKLILGTVQFGLPYGINNSAGKPNKEDVFRILEYAFQNGIRELDTADAYGDAQKIIGQFIAQTGCVFRINTKFNTNEKAISEQLEYTLSELAVRHVETYFFHSFSDFEREPAILEELKQLQDRGLIRNIGVSVYDNGQLDYCINCHDVNVIQLPFNLLDNYGKRGELMKKAKSNGKIVQVRSVFLQGLFFKSAESLRDHKVRTLTRYLLELDDLAAKHQYTKKELALAYALSQREIDQVIIGVDSVHQLQENLDILNVCLSSDLIRSINRIDVKETELLYPYNWA